MIPRRVIEQVRTQNWTAVALVFVNVVAGVFMGIQFGNWDQAREYRCRSKKSTIRRSRWSLEDLARKPCFSPG